MNENIDFRIKVLQAHYDISSGNFINGVIRSDIATKLDINDFNDPKLINAIRYLEDKGYLKIQTNMEDKITTIGIDEVENDFPTLRVRSEEAKTIGILNRGQKARYTNNVFANLNVGIQDEGEETIAEGNKFVQNSAKHEEEIVKLSPEFHGVSVNLKALWRRARKWFDKKMARSKKLE